MAVLKGICYGNDAFPRPYEEATANQTQVFFGSDAACGHMAPLWGNGYQSSTGAQCGSPPPPSCRYDLNKMKQMGVELIRLYDWDPRNYHFAFLERCQSLGIGVLVSVSNYFLKPGEGLPNMDKHIPELIRSYSNLKGNKGNNYHPAVEGIVFGNEFTGYGVNECVKFTRRWIEIESAQFPGYRAVPIGHPISFAKNGGTFPCWGVWDQLLPPLAACKSRLFLAPQTYNDASYLFQNAEGSKKGWVDLTYDQYQTPIWFTEIGQDRTKPNHVDIVKGQLSGCLGYSRQNPQKLIGACFFSYTDKVWKQGTSEGSFGAWTHKGQGGCTITYGQEDFNHWEAAPNWGTLNVDDIRETDLYHAVKGSYTSA
jgi:hypothetical protein